MGQIKNEYPAIETPHWRYVYAGAPKPFFHPIRTPDGQLLTAFEPADHPWHRGLWFTIKFINGENFWEEKPDETWGTQQVIAMPEVTQEPGDRILISSQSQWRRPNGSAVITERRRIEHHPLSEEAYALDLTFALEAVEDLLLDRTPFTTWGGYGGLTFRGNPQWRATRLMLSDRSILDRPTGERAPWCDLSSSIGGIAIFDHPSNPRHPPPWYGANGENHYFNAAFLFHDPMRLAATEKLTFRYRVLVHDRMWSGDELEKAYQAYIQ
jgi:hypothetical protein